MLLQVKEDEVLVLLDRILKSSVTNSVTKAYAINAVMKLSVRFPSQRVLAIWNLPSDYLFHW